MHHSRPMPKAAMPTLPRNRSIASPLHYVSLAADTPIHSCSTGVTVYPNAGVAFVESEPATLEDLDQLHTMLVSAAAAINAGATITRTWQSPLTEVHVTAQGYAVTINGSRHSPNAVAHYADEIARLLDAALYAT